MVDFGNLTGAKLKNIQEAKRNGNIGNISDINASNLNIDFDAINSIFTNQNSNNMVLTGVAANLAGMKGSEFMALSKEEQSMYKLLANLMDADGNGKVTQDEMHALLSLSGENDAEKLDQTDIAKLLQIVSDAGVEDLLNDIDGVLAREAAEEREANHSHGEFANGIQIDTYANNEVYVTQNGKPIEGVTVQKDGSYTVEINGETKVFKPNDEKGIDFYNSVLEYNDSLLNINNQLDEAFNQQGTGDCYYLATLNALARTEDGRQIIHDSISYNSDKHSYTVKFAGIGSTYTFTADQIREAEEKRHDKVSSSGANVVGEGNGWYSEGDDDVLLLEMAFEQFRLECFEGKYDNVNWPDGVKYTGAYTGTDSNQSPLASGKFDQACYVLTGKMPTTSNDVHGTLDQLMNTQNSASYVIYAGVTANNGYVQNPDGAYYLDKDDNFKKVTNSTPADVQRFDFVGAGTNNTHIVLNGVGDDEGQTFKLTSNGTGGHALTVTDITDDTITLINPWDNAKEITVSREEFEGYVTNVSYADMNGQAQALKDRDAALAASQPRFERANPNAVVVTPPKESIWQKIGNFFKNLFR